MDIPDISTTVMLPTSFYTNFYSNIPMIKEQGMIISGIGGDDFTVFVSPKDIADAIVDEIESPFSVGKKIRYVASDEMTCNQAAKILGEAICKPDLKWIAIPLEQLRAGMKMSGLPEQLIDLLIEMQAVTSSGAVLKDYNENKPVLGKVKLTDFAKEFAIAYNQS